LLKSKGVAFEEVDVTGDDESRQQLVELSGGRKTVPQIFIGAVHIGGYADLARLESDGKVDALLASARARGPHGGFIPLSPTERAAPASAGKTRARSSAQE